MEKDFWKWHSLKSEIEKQIPSPLFYEREIWWCSVGANVGAEEDGKNDPFERPVLVLRKFNRDMFWGIPITSKEKYGEYYYPFSLHGESMCGNRAGARISHHPVKAKSRHEWAGFCGCLEFALANSLWQ
jgi:hypothetical protein